MRIKIFLIATIACLVSLLMVNSALAVNFDSSALPGTIDGGTSDILLNFTVTNNDGALAITKVNITLPAGFSYSGGATYSRDDLATFNVLENNILSWINTTQLVTAGVSQYFWFYVDSTQTMGDSKFNVSTNDSASAFSSKNVTVEVADLSAPTNSSVTTSPSTPTAYAPHKNYTFNITWNDNVASPEQIKFEWQDTTNYTNTSGTPVVSIGSGVYGITLTDLVAGNYSYKWFATDWNGTANATDATAYNITKADNPINLYFNGNLNQDQTINDGTQLNITATAKGTIYIYENDSLLSSGIGPLTNRKTPSVAAYIYKANATGDSNYTVNSTGVSYDISVIYPPPRYSISTSIPSTWSRNAYALFNITWADDNDADGFDVALIQLNHSGTATNYTMTRITGTTISTYELNITNPMAFSWKVYANNSLGTWNSTPLANVTISKVAPTLSLTASPSWSVIKGTQTIISCTSPHVTTTLYRDEVLVSAPDIQTLSTGDYVYVCNNTATVNYSSARESNILYVYRYMGDVSFVQYESLISVEQGASNSTTVILENVGNASQSVTFSVENITSTWYTLNATSVSLSVGERAAFLVNFTIDASTEVKDYTGQYKASTVNKTATSDFVLRVMPKEETQSDISTELALHRVNMTNLWNEINQSKARDVNVTVAEEKIIEAKEKIELAEEYIDNNDYFSAYQLFDDIESLISAAETELEAALTEAGYKRTPLPSWAIWALVGTGICVGGALIYLLWPQSGYNEKTGRYTHKTPKERGLEALSEKKQKIVGKIIKPTVTYKPEFKQPSFKPLGIEIGQPTTTKVGRYTAQKDKTLQKKISEKFSKLKNMFKKKRKYEEVELTY